MLHRSSKNNAKSVTLKDLDSRSSKQYNQSAHNRKLNEEETYNQSEVDFTVDSSSNIKELRSKNFIEIEREPKTNLHFLKEIHLKVKEKSLKITI